MNTLHGLGGGDRNSWKLSTHIMKCNCTLQKGITNLYVNVNLLYSLYICVGPFNGLNSIELESSVSIVQYCYILLFSVFKHTKKILFR